MRQATKTNAPADSPATAEARLTAMIVPITPKT